MTSLRRWGASCPWRCSGRGCAGRSREGSSLRWRIPPQLCREVRRGPEHLCVCSFSGPGVWLLMSPAYPESRWSSLSALLPPSSHAGDPWPCLRRVRGAGSRRLETRAVQRRTRKSPDRGATRRRKPCLSRSWGPAPGGRGV